jgi:hypothetical protein
MYMNTSNNKAHNSKIDDLLKDATELAQDSMRSRDRVPPTFVAHAPSGVVIITPPKFSEDFARTNYPSTIRNCCVLVRAVAGVLTMPVSWTTPGGENPLDGTASVDLRGNVSNALFLSAEIAGGASVQRILPILRDKKGRFQGFGHAETVSHQAIEGGKYSCLLPPRPPTDQERRKAMEAMEAHARRAIAAGHCKPR